MKYFTKEFIREADCKEIQGLRPTEKGVWFWTTTKGYLPYWSNGKINYYTDRSQIWLPTGDQLNEEIKQFCMKNPLLRYEVSWIGTCWEAYILENDFPKPKAILFEGNDNPLIAKIKLLKALLKENKKC